MKRLLRFLRLSLFLPLASCALLVLPFTLVGFLFQGVLYIFNSLINTGAYLATEAVKYAPYGLIFAKEDRDSPAAHDIDYPLEKLAAHLESAPIQIVSQQQAMQECGTQASTIILTSVDSFFSQSEKTSLLQQLRGKEIIAVRWVQADN